MEADPVGTKTVRKVDNDDEMAAYRKERVKNAEQNEPRRLRMPTYRSQLSERRRNTTYEDGWMVLCRRGRKEIL